ncbi:hypothetical protein BKA70DRAFT_1244503 [Coprinopsis sp. MPI-PUGE-AT-0042]|nr:hypothetical protein BKA70DRAFT_1244503 [Coprinopsis sp. MPI-PUGE-AT-0042]
MPPTNSQTHRAPPSDVPVSPSPTTATSHAMDPQPSSGPFSSRHTPSIIFEQGFAETVGYLTSPPQERASNDDEEPPLTPQATTQSGTSAVSTGTRLAPEVGTSRPGESGYTGFTSRFAPSASAASSASVTTSNSYDATTAAVSDISGDIGASSAYPAFGSGISSAPYTPPSIRGSNEPSNSPNFTRTSTTPSPATVGTIDVGGTPLAPALSNVSSNPSTFTFTSTTPSGAAVGTIDVGDTPPASALSNISTDHTPWSIARSDESAHPSEAVEGEPSLFHERSRPHGQGRFQYDAHQNEPEAIDEQGSSTQPQARYDADRSLNATRCSQGSSASSAGFPYSQRRSAHRALRVTSGSHPSLSYQGDLTESGEETDDIYVYSYRLTRPTDQPRSYWSPDTSVRNSMSTDSVEGMDVLEEGVVAPTADEHERTGGGSQGYIAAVARAAATEVRDRMVRDPAELIGMINHFVGAFADRVRNVGESGLRIWASFFPATPIQRFGQARNPNLLLPRFNHPLQHRWEAVYAGPSPFDNYPHCVLVDFIMPDAPILTLHTGPVALHPIRSWKSELVTTTVLLQWRRCLSREIVM